MIRAERIEKIKELARKQDIITWEEIQRCLNVSKATAQRDVEILCNASVLQKTRGGAIYIQEPDARELSLAAREITNREEKRRIAAAALEFVEPGSTIMLDSGSTVLELARQIPADIPLTAITYELPTAVMLDSNPNAEIYLLGGKLRRNFEACHGYFAENMLSQFHASVCFLGIDAVNIQNGIGQHNMYDVRIKQIMIENSAKVILLADHSKFTNMVFIHVASLSQIDVIITDSRLDKSILQELDRQGIRVIIVPME